MFLSDTPINVYNDNNACVCWSKSTTTKGLRYIAIRENAIRESVDDNFISVKHIVSKLNIADIFTKEMKDFILFKQLVAYIVSSPPSPDIARVTKVTEEKNSGHFTHGSNDSIVQDKASIGVYSQIDCLRISH